MLLLIISWLINEGPTKNCHGELGSIFKYIIIVITMIMMMIMMMVMMHYVWYRRKAIDEAFEISFNKTVNYSARKDYTMFE